MKLYRATSLDDIAKQFRKNAQDAQNKMNRSTARDNRNALGGQAMAWNAAAEMLENIELVEN